jgi:hypothetical protein
VVGRVGELESVSVAEPQRYDPGSATTASVTSELSRSARIAAAGIGWSKSVRSPSGPVTTKSPTMLIEA